MFRNLKLAPRMAVLIILGVGLVAGVATWYDYIKGRELLKGELQGRVENLAAATAGEMEVVKRAVEKVVQEVAVVLEDNPLSTEQSYRLLERTIQRHHELYGAAIVLNTPLRDSQGREIVPYVHRSDGSVVRKNLNQPGYPLRQLDWYYLPSQIGQPVWTEPYYDEGGGDEVMVTYSVPLRDPKTGKFLGVVTGDISLHWLRGLVKGMNLGEGGEAFIISRAGTFVAHPDDRMLMTETIFSLAEQRRWKGMRPLGQEMIRGGRGFVPVDLTDRSGDEFWIAYTPVMDMGWSLGAFFPQRQVMGKLYELGRFRLLVSLLGGLLLIFVVWRISRTITRPLVELEAAAQGVAAGNLETPIPMRRGRDEVAVLARTFSKMQEDLKRYVSELENAAAERGRLERDLKVAHDIQTGLVPHGYALTEFTAAYLIAADLQPAREVGGDFYDFFFLDPGRLFLAVGDASGKGIPAALFVAVTQAYLRAFIRGDTNPGRVLGKVNDALAGSNDTNMFISLFCGVLDIRTGELTYANAGHNPTYLVGQEGTADILPEVKGGLLGLFPGQIYQSATITLKSGQSILAYSDGIVEAKNGAEAFYTEERMAAFVSARATLDPDALVSALKADVASFVGDAPQHDDMTVLVLKRTGL